MRELSENEPCRKTANSFSLVPALNSFLEFSVELEIILSFPLCFCQCFMITTEWKIEQCLLPVIPSHRKHRQGLLGFGKY